MVDYHSYRFAFLVLSKLVADDGAINIGHNFGYKLPFYINTVIF